MAQRLSGTATLSNNVPLFLANKYVRGGLAIAGILLALYFGWAQVKKILADAESKVNLAQADLLDSRNYFIGYNCILILISIGIIKKQKKYIIFNHPIFDVSFL